MFYSNAIFCKTKPGGGAVKNMVNTTGVEVHNAKQFIKRLQRYQEEIGRLSGSR